MSIVLPFATPSLRHRVLIDGVSPSPAAARRSAAVALRRLHQKKESFTR